MERDHKIVLSILAVGGAVGLYLYSKGRTSLTLPVAGPAGAKAAAAPTVTNLIASGVERVFGGAPKASSGGVTVFPTGPAPAVPAGMYPEHLHQLALSRGTQHSIFWQLAWGLQRPYYSDGTGCYETVTLKRVSAAQCPTENFLEGW